MTAAMDSTISKSTAHEKKTHKRSTLTDIVSWGFLEKRSRLVYQNFCTHTRRKRDDDDAEKRNDNEDIAAANVTSEEMLCWSWKRKREEKRDTWNYRNYQIDRRAFGEVCVILFSIQYISSGLVNARQRSFDNSQNEKFISTSFGIGWIMMESPWTHLLDRIDYHVVTMTFRVVSYTSNGALIDECDVSRNGHKIERESGTPTG